MDPIILKPITITPLDVCLGRCGTADVLYRLRLEYRRPSGLRQMEVFIGKSLVEIRDQMVQDLGIPEFNATNLVSIGVEVAAAVVN